MTRYRVTATMHGKRIATKEFWETKNRAQNYADETNENYHHARALVVRDSERVRKMIP
jgi:hypothetical protein